MEDLVQCALFLYWLRTNDIYFLKKKLNVTLKRFAEKQKEQKFRRNTKSSRFGESNKRTRTRALICKFPITPAAPNLRSDRVNANEVDIQPNRSTLNEPERNAV